MKVVNTYGDGGQAYGAFEKNETVQQEDSSDNEKEGGDASIRKSSSKDKTSKSKRSKDTKPVINELLSIAPPTERSRSKSPSKKADREPMQEDATPPPIFAVVQQSSTEDTGTTPDFDAPPVENFMTMSE